MIDNKRVLCIIPARGGSQGVKDKNIRLFNGRPLIHWALDTLTGSEYVDDIAVSTDSKKIEWGVTRYVEKYQNKDIAVWVRPKKLAGNSAHVMDTMQYHTRSLKSKYDYIIMHHATAPLVTSEDIDKALRFMVNKDADFVISMCKSEGIGVTKPIPESGYVKGWFPESLKGLNRQEMADAYQLDNNIYIGKWDIFYYGLDYWGTDIYAFKMPRSKCADIDTEEDFLRAEVMQRRQHGETNC